MFNPKIKKKLLLSITTLFLFFSFNTTYAAKLSLEPNLREVKVGEIVTITVFVNSEGEAINNIDGQVMVPNDVLEIQSVSTSGSIVSLWVEQPVWNLSQVSFNGGVTNPGYTGSRGKIVSFTAKALKSGSASITFKSASVRANDGLGTDVLKTKTNTTVAVISSIAPVTPIVPTNTISPIETSQTSQPESQASVKKPSAPNIKYSHSQDAGSWYNKDSITFSWDLPKNTIAIRTLFNDTPSSNPTIVYNPAIFSKNIESIKDGIHFFHLQYQTPEGWSAIAHKELKIDTVSPEKPIVIHKVLESGLVQINLMSNDGLSGLAKYILSTEGKENIELSEIQEDGSVEFVFPFDYVGNKIIKIDVFDRAGNVFNSSIFIDFPYNAEYQKTLIQKENKMDVLFEKWLSAVKSIGSVINHFSLILLVLIVALYIMARKGFFVKTVNEKNNRIQKIEDDAIALMDSLKENILEDIHLLKVDRNIKNTKEAEDVLLKNLLQDFKTVEKVISTKLKKNKTDKKDTENFEE